MRNFESWILAYLLNSLWQVPLLFAAGWLAARALRPVGAAAEHRVWVVVLLLQSLLPGLFHLSLGVAAHALLCGAGTQQGWRSACIRSDGCGNRNRCCFTCRMMLLATIAIVVCRGDRIFRRQVSLEGDNPLCAPARSRSRAAHR